MKNHLQSNQLSRMLSRKILLLKVANEHACNLAILWGKKWIKLKAHFQFHQLILDQKIHKVSLCIHPP